VQPQPLALLALVKSHFDTLVWLQLRNPQGVSLFSFVHPPPRLSQPFAGAPVYDMSLTHAERLCALGCGLKGKLVRLLSLGVGRHFEPQRNWGACCKMMQSNVQHVAAGLAAAVRDEVAKEAEELCASGQCAAAVVPLQRAIDWGDLPSRALMACLLIDGREGVAEDQKRGLELAEEGARLGCHHCQGVTAWYYVNCYGYDDENEDNCDENYEQLLELARVSSGRGSKYGQLTLGELYRHSFFTEELSAGLAVDYSVNVAQRVDLVQALVFYRLAAVQGLDEAQCKVGYMYENGCGIARDYAEAMRWYQLAAAQGHSFAMYKIAECYEDGLGVAADEAEANRWYRRAYIAGCYYSDYYE
jgi:TPR repeat protein